MTETQTPHLTSKQAAVLEFIKANTQAASPTSREIARHFNFRSPHAVTVHLKALERKGFVRRIPGRSRNIEVIA
jgi:repressor LexA